jgi:hypothetical protein
MNEITKISAVQDIPRIHGMTPFLCDLDEGICFWCEYGNVFLGEVPSIYQPSLDGIWLVSSKRNKEIRELALSFPKRLVFLLPNFETLIPPSKPSLQHNLGLGVEGFLSAQEPKVVNLHQRLTFGIVDYRLLSRVMRLV